MLLKFFVNILNKFFFLLERGQVLPGFDEIVTILIDEAKSNGLENEDIILIADVLKEVHFSMY